MFNINQLLERVKSLRNSDIGIRMAVQAAVKNNTNIEVPVENIGVRSCVAGINKISQAARGEIFIKKIKILEDIKISLGEGKVRDIK